MDHSLRELGIGDQGVPKRMKKLARMFYGRVAAYGEALDADDPAALAAALTRNIRPDLEFWPHARYLSEYVLACRDCLQKSPTMLWRRATFPIWMPGRLVLRQRTMLKRPMRMTDRPALTYPFRFFTCRKRVSR